MTARQDLSPSRDAVADPVALAADAHAGAAPHAPEQPGAAAEPRAMGHAHPHESARAQVAGSATYIDDIAEI